MVESQTVDRLDTIRDSSLVRLITLTLWLALILLTMSGAAFAQQNELESLTRAEAEARAEKARLEAARETVSGDIAALKRELAKASSDAQAFEREGERLSAAVADADRRLADLENRQAANKTKTMELLAALQRLELSPSAASIADPDDAVRTAQAAQMIDHLSKALQDRAAALARLSEELIATRDEAKARRTELDANNQELLRQRNRIEALLQEKENARQAITEEARAASAEVERLAAESATLRDLLERLAEPVPETGPSLKPVRPNVDTPVIRPDGTVRFADAKGALVRPVTGTLTRRFGRGDQGETYSVAGEAQVLAPYSGRVEFAGPFKGYGRVVILNMDDGYFLLLTGLDQIFVNTRENVLKSEPIGLMPSGASAELYLELRQNGRTINPAPWFG